MCEGTCWLTKPVGAAGLVVGLALVADAGLVLSGHESLSTHAGRYPRLTAAALAALLLHFNSARLWRRAP